jgi:hypothetical protein
MAKVRVKAYSHRSDALTTLALPIVSCPDGPADSPEPPEVACQELPAQAGRSRRRRPLRCLCDSLGYMRIQTTRCLTCEHLLSSGSHHLQR